jgi:hypothetical protein
MSLTNMTNAELVCYARRFGGKGLDNPLAELLNRLTSANEELVLLRTINHYAAIVNEPVAVMPTEEEWFDAQTNLFAARCDLVMWKERQEMPDVCPLCGGYKDKPRNASCEPYGDGLCPNIFHIEKGAK